MTRVELDVPMYIAVPSCVGPHLQPQHVSPQVVQLPQQPHPAVLPSQELWGTVVVEAVGVSQGRAGANVKGRRVAKLVVLNESGPRAI